MKIRNSFTTWLSLSGLALALCSPLACGGDDSASGGSGATGGGGAGAATGGSNTGGDAGGGSTATGGTGAVGGSTATGGSGGAGGNSQPVTPRIGAHGLSYYRSGENNLPTIDTPPLSTKPSGSTLIVSVGRGDFPAFTLPTDNKGNQPYEQLGTAHTYTYWPTSGTALYSFQGAVGGANHILTNTNVPGDEITLAAVEVTGATHIQDSQWVEKLDNGQSITSAPVTTTGPATLVAFWWGDGGANDDKVAVPNNGFVVLDSIGLSGSLVQCYVAAKEVDAAGTYDVTWEATPSQGAQLWLVAVE